MEGQGSKRSEDHFAVPKWQHGPLTCYIPKFICFLELSFLPSNDSISLDVFSLEMRHQLPQTILHCSM